VVVQRYNVIAVQRDSGTVEQRDGGTARQRFPKLLYSVFVPFVCFVVFVFVKAVGAFSGTVVQVSVRQTPS